MPFRKKNPLEISPPNPVADWNDPINRGLVGAWMLSEGGGTKSLDWSGRGGTGAIQNYAGSMWKPGKRGTALKFDGSTSQHVLVPDSRALDIPTGGAVTMCAWVNLSGGSGYQEILAKRDTGQVTYPYGINFPPSGGMQVYTSGSSGVQNFGGYTLPTNKWVFIAGTISSVATELFANGALFGSQGPGGGVVSGAASLRIGALGAATELFNGLIWNARVFNRRLRASEIARLYSEPLAGVLAPRRRVTSAAPAVGTAIQMDFNIPASFEAGIWTNQITFLELSAAFRGDVPTAVEWTGDLRGDTAGPPIEVTASQQTDQSTAQEWLATSNRDSAAPLEWSASATRDAIVALSVIANEAMDTASPLSWSASLSEDHAPPLATNADLSVTRFVALEIQGAGAGGDALAPLSWAAGSRSDQIVALAFDALFQGTVSAPTEALATLSVTHMTPVEIIAGTVALLVDDTIPMDWTADLRRDTAGPPIEVTSSQRTDRIDPQEWLASGGGDSASPLESLAVAMINNAALLEGTGDIRRDTTGFPVEITASQRTDRSTAQEWLATLSVTNMEPVETLGSTVAVLVDDAVPVEWTGDMRRDTAGLPVETTAAQRTDLIVIQEWLASSNRDGASPLERLASALVNDVVPVEGAADLRGDTAWPPVEMTTNQRTDWFVVQEWLASGSRDTATALERLASAPLTWPGPIEWLGSGQIIQGDNAVPLEWAAFASRDARPPLDVTTNQTGDTAHPLTWTASLAIDRAGPVEWAIVAARIEVLPLAQTATLQVSPTVPIDASANEAGDTASPVSWTASFATDRRLGAEWTRDLSPIQAFPLDMIGAFRRDASLPLEVLSTAASVSIDAQAPLEWLSGTEMVGLGVVALETISQVLRSVRAWIEWTGTTPALPYVILTRVSPSSRIARASPSSRIGRVHSLSLSTPVRLTETMHAMTRDTRGLDLSPALTPEADTVTAILYITVTRRDGHAMVASELEITPETFAPPWIGANHLTINWWQNTDATVKGLDTVDYLITIVFETAAGRYLTVDAWQQVCGVAS